jgi:hypothetical protein
MPRWAKSVACSFLDSRSNLSFSNLQDRDNLSNLGQIMAGLLISCVQGWGWCANCYNEFEI